MARSKRQAAMRSPCPLKVLSLTVVFYRDSSIEPDPGSYREARGVFEGPRTPLLERGRSDEGSHTRVLLDPYPHILMLCALTCWTSVSSARRLWRMKTTTRQTKYLKFRRRPRLMAPVLHWLVRTRGGPLDLGVKQEKIKVGCRVRLHMCFPKSP